MNNKKLITASLLALLAFGGCTSNFVRPAGSTSYTTGGAVGGAAGGAVLGQLIGGDTKSTLIGTAAGALLGTVYGSHLQQQENEFRNVLASSGIGIVNNGSSILLTMPEGLTFSTGSAALKSNSYSKLNAIAAVLNKYVKSKVLVSGYTDSTGGYDNNVRLSQQRAMSVANHLMSQGVASNRFSVVGNGPNNPIAPNDSAQGRASNRRVTIQIIPR